MLRLLASSLVCLSLIAGCGTSSVSPLGASTAPSSSPTPTPSPAAAVVLDINKQVVYARDRHGAVVGRQLLAISQGDQLVCYSVYGNTSNKDLDRVFRAFDILLAAKLALPIFSDNAPAIATDIPFNNSDGDVAPNADASDNDDADDEADRDADSEATDDDDDHRDADFGDVVMILSHEWWNDCAWDPFI